MKDLIQSFSKVVPQCSLMTVVFLTKGSGCWFPNSPHLSHDQASVGTFWGKKLKGIVSEQSCC